MRQCKKFSIGDRVSGKVDRYLTHVWVGEAGPLYCAYRDTMQWCDRQGNVQRIIFDKNR